MTIRQILYFKKEITSRNYREPGSIIEEKVLPNGSHVVQDPFDPELTISIRVDGNEVIIYPQLTHGETSKVSFIPGLEALWPLYVAKEKGIITHPVNLEDGQVCFELPKNNDGFYARVERRDMAPQVVSLSGRKETPLV